MVKARISIDRGHLADFCRRNHIRKLSLFGSVLRGKAGPDSDIDLLAEFEPGHPVGFLDLARMERELSRMAGRNVDLRTPRELSRLFRREVVESARVQYVHG